MEPMERLAAALNEPIDTVSAMDEVVARTIAELSTNQQQVVQKLMEGGPTVDHATLALFVTDELNHQQRMAVWCAIMTWRDWYDAYLEAADAWESGGDNDSGG